MAMLQGGSGAIVWQTQYTYERHMLQEDRGDCPSIYLVSTSTEYPEQPSPESRTTTYIYDFYVDSLQVSMQETVLPPVDGVSAHTYEVFDNFGRMENSSGSGVFELP